MSDGRILVVDDDPKLLRLVREILHATGYDVLIANTGEQALEMTAIEQPDLVIMDIVLQGELDGFEATCRIREFSQVPVIMLTAKVREADMLRGFECGVDDYITKPFSAKELVARVRAVMKRSIATISDRATSGSEIVCGDLRIDLLRRSVRIKHHDVHLTPTEYQLLHELALHPNQVMLHEQLLTAVWGPEYRNDIDYLRAYIHYLRKKLESDPANPSLIVSTPGVGYMLISPE